MKGIRLSFDLRIGWKQTDVHWVEEGVIEVKGGGIFGGSQEGVGGDYAKVSSALFSLLGERVLC